MLQQSQDYLKTYFYVVFGYLEGFVPFRSFSEKGNSNSRPPSNIWVKADDHIVEEALKFAKLTNQRSTAFYVIPGTVGKVGLAGSQDVMQMQTLLIDIDEGDTEHKLAELTATIGEPTVVVESGLKAYAINVAGKTFIVRSQVDAVKIIRSYLKKGHTNIDIGLAQINWHWHGCNFSSINEMLTPKNNLKYAAKLLTDLYEKHGDWQKVVRLYHSAKPHHHRQYSRKVLLSWLDDSDGT